ncbi:aminotransferase class IV [Niabella drilacis]|uniref:branched-chain-amino-acid transaminase n=1 Tax=Niabella drilacis (strain DSM 25811 / CCM 8410 / CCUG 62505 / LMG 26954 / E90) TaxID=1285928 RepID=A0A1G6N144_NIADE|nr:aminotransferase class IV [Niabella drilacis]SDC61558.1 branched-chain amino acid aminotransferase [Niabella drilacis]
MRWIFVNNNFAEEAKALLQTNDLAIQRGYAVFDYFRTVNNQPLFLNDYLDRFFNSAKELSITIPHTAQEIKEIIHQLIKKNDTPQSGIRMIATGGYSPDSYTPVQGNFILEQQPLLLPDAEKFEKGIRIMSYSYQRDLPAVKSINYLMGIWLQKQLKEKGLDDVIYFQGSCISEFPRANIFMITPDGTLATPARNILAGITRKKILEFAGETLPVQVRDISLTELKQAAEVFTTSTTRRILPVTEIDGIPIGNGKAGPLTRQLLEQFIRQQESFNESAYTVLENR